MTLFLFHVEIFCSASIPRQHLAHQSLIKSTEDIFLDCGHLSQTEQMPPFFFFNLQQYKLFPLITPQRLINLQTEILFDTRIYSHKCKLTRLRANCEHGHNAGTYVCIFS